MNEWSPVPDSYETARNDGLIRRCVAMLPADGISVFAYAINAVRPLRWRFA